HDQRRALDGRPLPAVRPGDPARDRRQGPVRHLARQRRARCPAGEVMAGPPTAASRPAAARPVAFGALAGAIAAAIAAVIVLACPSAARADDEFDGASVIFARGASLYRVDPRGKGETEVAQLPSRTTVRALRSDARGTVLLADLAGAWAWMPLDGSTRSLTDLPCGDGPAALADDGSAAACPPARAARPVQHRR